MNYPMGFRRLHLIAFSFLCSFALFPALPAGASERPGATDRPDMVVFLSDDHTVTDSALYGSTEIRTPNMERLAAAGMMFDQALWCRRRARPAAPRC